MKELLNIVVGGEFDSGKSTLIGRLLYDTHSISKNVIDEVVKISKDSEKDFEFAYLLDSFEEERRNQLTIDTTQVFCKNKRGKDFVFIDVPGHQELLKNMLCGSSYADIAILVVDVQKSVEEQTKRHAFILKFLGIEQIILALNKMDSIDFNENTFERIKGEITDLFKKIGITPRYILPLSAKQGENFLRRPKKMTWYKGLMLIEALNACFKKKIINNLRFPIQDIYNLNKEKVAVGEIISGKIKKGEKVKILPLNKERQVKQIRVFNKNRSVAMAPESIGLVLDEMDDLRRGQVICKPRLPKVTTEISAGVFCIHSLNVKENLKFRCSTQEMASHISQIMGVWDTASLKSKPKTSVLEKNDFAEVVVNTEKPVVIEKIKESNNLGRFILQNNKEIYAVGIIP